LKGGQSLLLDYPTMDSKNGKVFFFLLLFLEDDLGGGGGGVDEGAHNLNGLSWTLLNYGLSN
jgi:hypothetical protein